MLPFLEESNRPNNDAITGNLRKIRAEVIHVLHTGRRFDGKDKMPSVAGTLMRQVMDIASHDGLSAEEAFLLLSYEALRTIERMNDQLLEYHLTTPRPILHYKRSEP